MTLYANLASPSAVPQSEAVDARQKPNHAGGFTFVVDEWTRLDRFLILGSDAGTYYVGARKLTAENAKGVKACLAADYRRTIDRIATVSDQGLAHKNDPAIFALALAASDSRPEVRAYALGKLPVVCRIGTHLLHFVSDVNSLRGWSAGLRRAVGKWFNSKAAKDVAFQVAKYQQRDGFAMRDVLRLAHVKPASIEHHAVYRYVVGAKPTEGGLDLVKGTKALDVTSRRGAPILRKYLPDQLLAIETLRELADNPKAAVKLIEAHRIPHECVPNELKSLPSIWEAMLPSMGLTAIIRNLGKMTSIGLIAPLSEPSKFVVDRLGNVDQLLRARVHPMTMLIALRQYALGHGLKGSLSWTPVGTIVDALDAGFYSAFRNVEPAGKNFFLALDVSGSMSSSMIANTALSARDASAAMAMVTAHTEKSFCIGAFATSFTMLQLSPRMRLNEVIAKISNIPFGGTDCSLPMLVATQQKLDVDAFVIYTDSETWAGNVHPHIALQQFRKERGKPEAKTIIVGMTATDISIADPSDPGMLDVVGFDASAPAIMSNFIRGESPRSKIEMDDSPSEE